MQKLFLAKAKASDLKVAETYVEQEYERAIASAYFHKGMGNIKKKVRRMLKEQNLIALVYQSITQNTTVNPREVRAYFAALLEQKRKYLPSAFQIEQFIMYPKIRHQYV